MVVQCTIPEENLPFELFGYCLQDPMGFLLNLVMSGLCLLFYFKLRKEKHDFQRNWSIFFLLFSLSTLFGGLGHLLFYYFGVYGQIPTWIFAILANYFPGKAMLSVGFLKKGTSQKMYFILKVKMIVFMSLMLFIALVYAKNSFVFVMADSAITFLVYCLGLGIKYGKNEILKHKGIIYGVFLLFPSIFIFVFKLDIALWFNKNDLSHVFMIFTLFFFYFGIRGGVREQKIEII